MDAKTKIIANIIKAVNIGLLYNMQGFNCQGI